MKSQHSPETRDFQGHRPPSHKLGLKSPTRTSAWQACLAWDRGKVKYSDSTSPRRSSSEEREDTGSRTPWTQQAPGEEAAGGADRMVTGASGRPVGGRRSFWAGLPGGGGLEREQRSASPASRRRSRTSRARDTVWRQRRSRHVCLDASPPSAAAFLRFRPLRSLGSS